jgi:hypothetical protein
MKVQDTRELSPEVQDTLRERVIQALLTQGMTVSAAARTFGVHLLPSTPGGTALSVTAAKRLLPRNETPNLGRC